jgi:hypothetical protein
VSRFYWAMGGGPLVAEANNDLGGIKLSEMLAFGTKDDTCDLGLLEASLYERSVRRYPGVSHS